MLRYVLRRFLLLIPMVLAASVIIFLMLRLGTGDPALDYLRLSNLPPTPEMLASTRTMLGLDQPLYVQYGTWLWKALHLDFGISFASQRPVLDDMLNFLPATLELAGAALVLILLTSVRLRGLNDKQTERRHILRNASLPMITAVGMHIGELIGGTMIIENIFAWPGVGRYAVSAIFNRDYPVIQCFTLMMVVVFVVCNLIVDLLNAALDPRIRRHEGAHA